MEKTISAAEANRRFSAILREAREGATYVITSHGRPVARIAPIEGDASTDARLKLIDRLKAQPVRKVGKWRRDDLYERES